MKLSNKGIALIKEFEGLRLKAYRDTAGMCTIGYGSTRYHDDKPVRPGDTLTSELQATSLFSVTLTQYENAVNKGAKVALTQNQFDALVSITYNVGMGIMQTSTLIKKLNAEDLTGAADQFLVWNKITDPGTGKKVVSETLTARRKKEREYFLTHE
ncbi:putative lysozyme [Mucilaginibacter polytrichastri]|uniref:Lysozyme n=2 Tax=Mucilaginibacter polytrichastri TaxID=1302689 RepID=A0A1Q5ZSU7_9SPHI|nr:putative lysozyme [Mucilaginibacter polytrichastri]SFS48823.1 Phage-related lysozyme (muramidase), GH24 family [Mucilaginibacter polytrichastri]